MVKFLNKPPDILVILTALEDLDIDCVRKLAEKCVQLIEFSKLWFLNLW
jgi:hypothetical protein